MRQLLKTKEQTETFDEPMSPQANLFTRDKTIFNIHRRRHAKHFKKSDRNAHIETLRKATSILAFPVDFLNTKPGMLRLAGTQTANIFSWLEANRIFVRRSATSEHWACPNDKFIDSTFRIDKCID